jgi:heptosyltransferase-2
VIDRLSAAGCAKILIVADSAHCDVTQELMKLTQFKPVDFSGRFDLSQLASLFERCSLVISNDSGPVHLSVAVKTPVIAIFGRNQPGLSPTRWGPLGPLDTVLHKKTDCETCLAHACENQFKCLEAVTVEEVLGHARRILSEKHVFKV